MKTEHLAVEIRLEDDPERMGPGRLVGTLMPYGQKASDRQEMFESGSLQWPDDGVLLREMHDRQRPIARFVPVATDTEVRVKINLPDSVAGRSATANVVAGVYQGLSVEFRAIRETVSGGIRVVQEALLVGAGLVDKGSYAQALVEARGKVKRRRIWL